ncbi:hypothetical protein RHS04_02229 [Rhizoctonia solani]|uniref:Uncharacterized protein n=1 Tax=Rhizoctonia solani TaxID=456999 RepID=A0A8H7LM43_9AGAM|nr:hypothetical protein RHS04_02229 [Rhizoctonia solani]KAF8758765.1 hypothetical protein RHS01_02486 [Rhizoctonia solani]
MKMTFYFKLIKATLAIAFVWPLFNQTSTNDALSKVFRLQTLFVALSLIAGTVNFATIVILLPGQHVRILVSMGAFEITVNVIATALSNQYTYRVLPEAIPKRSTGPAEPNSHASPPNYQANTVGLYRTSASFPLPTTSPSTRVTTPEVSNMSETIKTKLETPPPRVSFKQTRGSYFNFMSSLVNLYSAREPTIDPERRRTGYRHTQTRSTLPSSEPINE